MKIDIILPNQVVEESIETESYLLVYQDGNQFRAKGKMEPAALASLLTKVNLSTVLPILQTLLKKK